MSVPPCFADLGKDARDVFSKKYNFGFFKIETSTKTKSNVEFKVEGSSNHDTGNVFGTFETKYKWADPGITVKEKWNTDNMLSTDITIEDQLLEGLKLTLDGSFAPVSGKKSAKIKAAYKRDYINLNCDVDLGFAGPTVHGAAVLGYSGWLAGAQISFDTANSKLVKNTFAAGYKKDDFQIHTTVTDASEFGGSLYQKISKDLETAVSLNWSSGTNTTRLNLGAAYTLDNGAKVRAKVNNLSQIGMAYSQELRDGVTLNLSSMIDAKNFNSGGHKVGLGLEFEV
ncbi:voltage-dependent anion-selective channel protein 2 [Lingula anatina]|uniref:Voltage-dependent anion-selective channel protein 2 n=1 Tax=Lingula anatina TaxID=7574 RepID=A0A1S3IT01_LINAN|nr:voltage-dependent anion-selective channel protein 2 [Lingula anatina]|eukprot:XP_013401327.1 voltage-dependent anion-selective channel protein 2 [Lingula anatina]